MRTSRPVAVLALALLLVLAGCSGAGGGAHDDGGAAAGDAAATAAEAEAKTAAPESGGSENALAARVDDRKLIRTAEVTVRVGRFESAKANLTAAARASGGYVGHVEQHTEEVGNETHTRGTVVLRVPRGNFSGIMTVVAAQGTVISKRTQTKEVTGQYVDLQARLKNLKRERARLRELYREANDTEAVLKVEARLSEVQGRIEQIQGKLRVLRNQVAYATVTVRLNEPRPEPQEPEREHWYDTGVVAAFMASMSGVGTVGRALVVGLAYALPYLLALGLPVLGIAVAYRHIYRQV